MSPKVSVVGCMLVLMAAVAGCATSSTSYPSASPGWVGSPITTDAPSIDNADAAGPASVPGVHTGTAPAVITPATPAASPVIVVPPPPPR